METREQNFVVKSCAHCGDGCETREVECQECRFFYCEEHVDPHTHDCHTVCVELTAFEREELEAMHPHGQLRLVFSAR